MSEYAFHAEALIDLDEIREHIAEDSPDATDRLIAEVLDGIRAPC
jgi:plasmid stabilization system protein ParE